MAKKSGGSKEFTFAAFDAAMSKVPGMEMGSIIDTNTFSVITDYIHTGNYLLNAQLSGTLFGGVADARSLGLVGDPETGKTFVCLNIVHNAVKQGYKIFWCDTEGALEKDDIEKFKIDPTQLRYQPIKTVEQFKIFMGNLLSMKKEWEAANEGEKFKFLVVLDSLGMLNTEKEVGDLKDNKVTSDMGIKAKQLRALFRAITLDMTGAKIPLIATNHTTIGGIGSYTGPTKESAGGDGPIFSFSNVLFLSKKMLNGSNDDLAQNVDAKTATGILITSKQKKARKQLKIPITLHVSFRGGMNPYVGLEEYVNWNACGIERGKIITVKEY
jgi:RecA/RadA recombinase